ncbi:MAG: PQQ-binding-like beta-propeller repeat protein, partial [Bacteroidota bacterium]
YGVLVCYDAKTGEKYWEKEYGSGFYSSPMIADGKVYIIDMGGVMHIIKAGKEGTVIGEPALGEKAFATPAFSDGRIYLRGASNLYCIGK